MTDINKSSILTLALWTKNPPVHNVSSILYLEKSNSIITGSESGHIIIWNNKKSNNQLVPQSYMIGHQSKIITLCLAGSYKFTNIDYFVSFSKDREIALWDAENARSIEFLTNYAFDIQSIYSFESENVKQRLLFCCLRSPEIVIINSVSLSEICTLVCSQSLNMFSAVTSFNMSTKDDIVLACTESGLTSIWIMKLSDIIKEPRLNPKIKESRSTKVDLSNPTAIIQNRYQTRIVLLISACKFVICYGKKWDVLCYQNSRRGDYFIGGEFISISQVIIHCKSGKSLCYKLPPRSDYTNPIFGQISSDLCANIPHLLYQFKEPKNLSMVRHKIATKISEHGYSIWKGFIDGTICKWEFNERTAKIESQVFSLTRSWTKMIKETSNLAKMIEGPDICGSVTSLLYLPDLSLFVIGMDNGSIFITTFKDSIESVFKKASQKNSDFVKLEGHCGPVLCLMHPCSTLKLPSLFASCDNPKLKACLQLLKLTHILWSGGEDFTLRIWNIKTQQCLNVFNCHSAPIILLRINHLSDSCLHVCGVSRSITMAMLNTVNDDDANSGEIRQLINTCMNSFIIAISEDEAISIFSVMKRKLLLCSIVHNSPVKRIGWLLDSGYALLETISDTVYVWDLSSRQMERYETDETAQALMENCSVITEVRSQSYRHTMCYSDMIVRHSLSSASHRSELNVTSDKVLNFLFIKTGSSDSFVPVIIFDLKQLFDSLDDSERSSVDFYSLLSEADNPVLQALHSKELSSNFDSLMMDVTKVNRIVDLKTSIIKIILSLTHLQHKTSQLDATVFTFLDMKSDAVACSFGKVNSKTGSVVFNLKDLFIESDETVLNIDDILLQLSISNKIINSTSRNRLESSLGRTLSNDMESIPSWPRKSSFSNASFNFSDYYSLTRFSKILLAYRKSIVDRNVSMMLQETKSHNQYSDFNRHLSFFTMERIFNCLIMGILDECDWINISAFEILAKVVTDLSYHDIQHYFLITRSILLSDLDHYTTEGGRSFSARIQRYIHQFSDQSFLIGDWKWWYLPHCTKTDHDRNNLTKIQINALIYLALIGTYLESDDISLSTEGAKPFSKIFSLDNFFLARITCDFLMNILAVESTDVKRTKNRLISMAMMCLSVGFKVWEPFLNSASLICQLFELIDDEEFEEVSENCLIISCLAKQALRLIAFTRPLLFITICHHEMIRSQIAAVDHSALNSHSLNSSTKSLIRMKSGLDSMNSFESASVKKLNGFNIIKSHIIFPILEELCETQSEVIMEILPDVVEIYINYHTKFSLGEINILQVLHPILKYTSVSVHSSSGHVSVGSSNGFLALFDYKIGKYFAQTAHLKAITYSLFSDDAKHLATYSVDESMIKIWQISHTGLFHSLSTMYSVKLVFSQIVPSIEEMIWNVNDTSFIESIALSLKEKKKKKKFIHGVRNKCSRPTSVISSDTGVGLLWDIDNRTLSIDLNGHALRKFKV